MLRQVSRLPWARPGHIGHPISGAVSQVHLPSGGSFPAGLGLCGPPILSLSCQWVPHSDCNLSGLCMDSWN